MGRIVEEALREKLARKKQREEEQNNPVVLPVFRGQGLQPGVDLDDSASMLDLMEE